MPVPADLSRPLAARGPAAKCGPPTREPQPIDVDAVVEEFRGSLLEMPVQRVAADECEPITVTACPVCRHQQARPTFTIDALPHRLVTCCQCGLGRVYPQPDAETIQSFYPTDYYGSDGEKFESWIEWLVRRIASRHGRAFSRGLGPGDRVLDVGCGRGVLLSMFADRGMEVHGFEISAGAATGADPRATIRIAADLKSASYPSSYFDQVVVWHVLEHVPDPRGTLEEIARILKPGGRLVVAVPNFSSFQAKWAGPDWFHLDLPRHLFHFPLSALVRLLEESGFKKRSVHHFSLRQNPFGWIQSGLNRVRWFPRNGLYTQLKQTGGPAQPSLSRRTRLLMRLAFLAAMPFAVALSVMAAIFRSGATVSVVAERIAENSG